MAQVKRTVRFLGGILMSALLACVGCSSTIANRMPLGERFPTVRGTSLDGKAYTLPEDLAGKPVLLLVGYKQATQFDIDRWLIGLSMIKTPIDVLEVPTIRGWAPRLIAGQIDQGMRSGIPSENWAIVVTVYKDAEKIVQFTGNTNPNNARAMLIDSAGIVRWYEDRGFSPQALQDMNQLARTLMAP